MMWDVGPSTKAQRGSSQLEFSFAQPQHIKKQQEHGMSLRKCHLSGMCLCSPHRKSEQLMAAGTATPEEEPRNVASIANGKRTSYTAAHMLALAARTMRAL